VPVLAPGLEHSGEFLAKAKLAQDALGVMAESHGAGQGIRLCPAFHHAHPQAALSQQQRGDLSDWSGSDNKDIAVVVDGHPSGPR
jgi:hypothetical protein